MGAEGGVALLAMAALIVWCDSAGAQRALSAAHFVSSARGCFDDCGALDVHPGRGTTHTVTTICLFCCPSPLPTAVRTIGFDFRKLSAGTSFVVSSVELVPVTSSPVVAHLRGQYTLQPNGVAIKPPGFIEVTSATLVAGGGAMTVEFVADWSVLDTDQYVFDCGASPTEGNIRISTNSDDAAKLDFKVRAALWPLARSCAEALHRPPPPRARAVRDGSLERSVRAILFSSFALAETTRCRCGSQTAISQVRRGA